MDNNSLIHRHESIHQPSLMIDATQAFKRLYYYLYSNSNLPRAECLAAEVLRILFCKILDEQHGTNELKIFPNDNFKSVWSRINTIFTEVKKMYPTVFDTNEKMLIDEKSAFYVLQELQGWEILQLNQDTLGEIFEVFLGSSIRGERGQFFTPRNVVRMMVDMLNPTIEERIIDPVCGSGGFLVEALNYIEKNTELSYRQGHAYRNEIAELMKTVRSQCIFGVINLEYYPI